MINYDVPSEPVQKAKNGHLDESDWNSLIEYGDPYVHELLAGRTDIRPYAHQLYNLGETIVWFRLADNPQTPESILRQLFYMNKYFAAVVLANESCPTELFQQEYE